MHTIGMLVYPGFSPVSLAAAGAFETANAQVKRPAYAMAIVSESGGPVSTGMGATMQTSSIGRRRFDTLIVAGGMRPPTATPGLASALRSALRRRGRIASICTGALLLAEAGLLDGRRATTHWAHAADLQRRCPKVVVEPDRIFTHDGLLWTSAGMSAGLDLAVAMVEQDLGAAVARQVAKVLVLHHRRAGGQSQFSTLLELDAKSDRVQTALAYAKAHLGAPLSVDRLAAAAFLSPRQFSRLFHDETGQSPAKAIERLRVEAARLMMESGRFSVDEIARQNGFGNRERMRRSFLRAFGQSPQALRRAVTPAGRPDLTRPRSRRR